MGGLFHQLALSICDLRGGVMPFLAHQVLTLIGCLGKIQRIGGLSGQDKKYDFWLFTIDR